MIRNTFGAGKVLERAKGIEPSYAAWEARKSFNEINLLNGKNAVFDAKEINRLRENWKTEICMNPTPECARARLLFNFGIGLGFAARLLSLCAAIGAVDLSSRRTINAPESRALRIAVMRLGNG